MGPNLFATFHAAGLPDPELIMEAVVGGGDRTPAFGWANIARAILPLMERLGVATESEVDPDTLTERLMPNQRRTGPSVSPHLYGAWATI